MSAVTPTPATSRRILIVEDEALVAMDIEAVLDDAGCTIIGSADTIDGAIALAEAQTPSLALVDMRLSRGDSGMDAAARFKAMGIPVVFMTGNCPDMAGDGNAIGCLHKPFNDRSLTQAVAIAHAVIAGEPIPALPSGFHLFA